MCMNFRESEGDSRVYESILTTENQKGIVMYLKVYLLTENQKGMVVCMKVKLQQRIRRAWSCV